MTGRDRRMILWRKWEVRRDELSWISTRTSVVVTTGIDRVSFGLLLQESPIQVEVVQEEWQWAMSEGTEENESSKRKKSGGSRPARLRESPSAKRILKTGISKRKGSGVEGGNHREKTGERDSI